MWGIYPPKGCQMIMLWTLSRSQRKSLDHYPSQEKNEEDPNQCVFFCNSHSSSSSFYFYFLHTMPTLFPMERWERRFGRSSVQKDTLLWSLQLDPSLKPSKSKTWSQRGGFVGGEQHSCKCNWHTEIHWGADQAGPRPWVVAILGFLCWVFYPNCQVHSPTSCWCHKPGSFWLCQLLHFWCSQRSE